LLVSQLKTLPGKKNRHVRPKWGGGTRESELNGKGTVQEGLNLKMSSCTCMWGSSSNESRG
jgi:hypothetical protein